VADIERLVSLPDIVGAEMAMDAERLAHIERKEKPAKMLDIMSFYIAYWHLYREKYFVYLGLPPDANSKSTMQQKLTVNSHSTSQTLALMQRFAKDLHEKRLTKNAIGKMWGNMAPGRLQAIGTANQRAFMVFEVDQLIEVLTHVLKGDFDLQAQSPSATD